MFDTAKFLRAHWSNERGLVQFVRVYGVPPPKRATARRWFERESIPAAWFATLLVLLELERGRPPSLKEYWSSST